jgi:hypothetical protein
VGGRLEEVIGLARAEWPPTLLRGLWETLMEAPDRRGLSPGHEARWLNLAGFALRPGFGVALDDWRVAQTWRLYPARLFHPRNEGCRAEWWILWRRTAGGMTAGQQQTLAEPLLAAARERARAAGAGRAARGGKGSDTAAPAGLHERSEAWRLLGSLELLPLAAKIELGGLALDLLGRTREAVLRDAAVWALGRIGSRVPVYGPLDTLVPTEVVEAWTGRLAELAAGDPGAAFCLVQLARRTGDRYRDVGPAARRAVVALLSARGAPPRAVTLVTEGGRLGEEEERLVFGEALPRGLRLE